MMSLTDLMIYDILFMKGGDFMNCVVLGIRHIKYTNKEGRIIIGNRLYVSYHDQYTNGLASMDVFLPIDIQPPEVGDQLLLRFNRYGRCVGYDFAG